MIVFDALSKTIHIRINEKVWIWNQIIGLQFYVINSLASKKTKDIDKFENKGPNHSDETCLNCFKKMYSRSKAKLISEKIEYRLKYM